MTDYHPLLSNILVLRSSFSLRMRMHDEGAIYVLVLHSAEYLTCQ